MTQQEILIAIRNNDISAKDDLANYGIRFFLRFSSNYFSLRSITAIMHFPAVCEESYNHLAIALQNTENDDLLNVLQDATLPDDKLSHYLEQTVWKEYLINYIKAERKKDTVS